MGLNFRKSIKVAPRVKVNLSSKGVGVSVGEKGARVSVGPSGTRLTSSIPGTGLSYKNVSVIKRGKLLNRPLLNNIILVHMKLVLSK